MLTAWIHLYNSGEGELHVHIGGDGGGGGGGWQGQQGQHLCVAWTVMTFDVPVHIW